MGVFSNNRPNIVPGALISSSYVSDLYDLLSGAKSESFVLVGSLSATGSLQGTASFATSASRSITASYSGNALTASYASNTLTASFAQNAISASYAVSASYEINYETSSSYADNALTASFAQNALTASFAISSSRATSASFATNAVTASVTDNIIIQNFSEAGVTHYYPVYSGNIGMNPTSVENLYSSGLSSLNGVLYIDSGTGTVYGTASFATSASRSTSSSRAISANTADVASTVAVQGTVGSGNYFLTMVDSQNFSSTAELVNTQDLAYDGTAGVLSFFNGVGTVQATASFASTASYALNAPSAITIATSSTQIYVSVSGSDSSNGLSSIQPLRTLYAAKTAAISGSVVYVMAGEYVFDNTAGALNGTVSQIDLWKNGVTYYFMPGAKIKFINHGNVGTAMALFNATSTTNETCTVLGHLEFEQTGVGPDNSVGHNYFFKLASDGGGTFYAQVKSLVSNHTSLVDISKSNTAGTVFTVTIIADEERWSYSAGQTGNGSLYHIAGNGSDSVLRFQSQVKNRTYQYRYDVLSLGWAYQFRDTFSPSTYISIDGDTLINLQKPLTRFRNCIAKNVNININRIYFDRSYATDVSSIITDPFGTSNNYVLNMNADLIDLAENSYSDNIFSISAPNGTINYAGNIFTKSTGGGRTIVNFNNFYGAKGNASNNRFNMVGNIYLLGSADNATELFYNVGSSTNTINFTGQIYGQFNYLANINSGGTMNINNSNIESTATYGLMCLHNANTTTSTLRILNSNIKMANTSYMSDSRYYNMLIHNSSIINTSTGHTLYNPLNAGTVQLLNSSVYAHSSSLAINYTSSIIAGNTIINTVYSGSLTGSLTTLTQMIS